MPPLIQLFIFVAVFCLCFDGFTISVVIAQNLSENQSIQQQSQKQSQNQASTSRQKDDFFGNIDEHFTDHHSMASKFFKPHDDDDKSSKNDINTKSQIQNKNQCSIKRRVDDSETFSCSKRALISYKLIVNIIYRRLNSLSKFSSGDSDSIPPNRQLHLHMHISYAEISLLNKHLAQLESILNDQEEKLSTQTLRFCRNLDSLENSVQKMVDRLTMTDPNHITFKNNWRNSLRNVFPNFNLNQAILWLVVLAIVLLVVFFLFPHHSPQQFQAITAIVLLILFISMYQFYLIEYRQHQTKTFHKKGILNSENANICGYNHKLYNFILLNGYQCYPSEPSLSGHTALFFEDDFYENFNLLEFLSKFFVAMILSPLKQFSRGIMELFEELLDGETSQDWHSLGAWVRSVLFSTVLRPFFIVAIIYISWKFTIFFNLLRLIGYLFSQNSQPEPLRPSVQNESTNLPQQSLAKIPSQPSIIYHQKIEHLTVHMDHKDSPKILPYILNNQPLIDHLIQSTATRSLEDEEDNYLSANEGDD